MTVLVDTHVLLWLAGAPQRLSKEAKRCLQRATASGGLAIASITLWEVALHASARRISISGTFANWSSDLLARSGIAVLELTPEIAELATLFGPDYPRDPADRIIGATARQHGMSLVTADQRLQACPLLNCIW